MRTPPASTSTESPMTFRYRSKTGATLLDVREAMISLKRSLILSRVSELEISSAEIVVTEVLNNVVKHAQTEQVDGWFELQCDRVDYGLRASCRDNGLSMPGGDPPGGIMPPIHKHINDLPEGGWGWSLVRALTKDLSYVRIDDINVVSFEIPATSAPANH